MFKFLQRLQASTLLADCEKELKRTTVANVYFRTERDASLRAKLLRDAVAAGLGEHETVKRLDFLQRLLTALDGDPSPTVQDALLAEAKGLELEEVSGVLALRAHRNLELLKERGPQVVTHDSQGRAIYFRCGAEFKNKPGQFEVRDDGVTFTGEVVVEVPWSNVVHAAKTAHTYQGMDYCAVALQEGKRRTPTKFVFTRDSEAAYACEVTMQLWEQSRKRSAT